MLIYITGQLRFTNIGTAAIDSFKISRHIRRRNMLFAILSSVGSVLTVNFALGNVLLLTVIKLGADEIFIGMLSFLTVIPTLSCILNMPAIERVKKTKILVPWYLLSMVSLAPLLLIPTMAERIPVWLSLSMIGAIVFIRSTFSGLGTTGWFPLLHDIVPRRFNGRFFALLRTSWQSAGLIAMFISAAILGRDPGWFNFQILFILGLVAEAVRVFPLTGIVEKPVENFVNEPPAVGKYLIDFFKYKPLRSYNLYLLLMALGVNAAEPFKVKLLYNLDYTYSYILISTAMVALGAVISLRFWGRMIDKFGTRAIFSISPLGMALVTFMWILVGTVSPANQILVLGLYLAWGIFSSGNGLAQTNYLFKMVPKDKQNFTTLTVLITHFGFAIAPLISGVLLATMTAWGLFSFRSSYNVIFTITAVLLLVNYLMRINLRISTDKPTNEVVSLMVRPMYDMFIPLVRRNKDRS